MNDHGCYVADRCVMVASCPFVVECAVIESGDADRIAALPHTLLLDGPDLPLPSQCWNCRCKGFVTAAALHWTGPSRNTTYLCQPCADSWLDNADDDPSLEPRRIDWLDGTRTLVGAA